MATKKSPSKPSKSKTAPSPFATQLNVHLQAIVALIKREKLAQLTPEQFKYTVGRIPSSEVPSLKIVIDLMDERPELFAVLSNKDGGKDPKKLETEPTRLALARFEELAPMLEVVASIHDKLEHEALAQGARVRAVTSPAYQLAKVMSHSDEDVANTLGPAFTHYGEPGRKAKAKRK